MRIHFIVFIITAFSTIGYAQHAKFDPDYKMIDVGEDFEYVATGDINGDGLTDIAGATDYYFDSGDQHKIFVWLQGANGQLNTPIKIKYPFGPFPVVYRAACFAVSDLYNDGTAEILLGTDNFLSVYSYKNYTLVLEETIVTTDTYQVVGVTTADFDGDGFTDIAACHADGNRITVIYRHGPDGAKWDKREYGIITGGNGHVIAGKFGPLTQTALIYIGERWYVPDVVLTFDTLRSLKNHYSLGTQTAFSAAIVKKGGKSSNELWVTAGGNTPNSKVLVWRGLQSTPDSVFDIYDIPSAIQSANLDCDGGDEPVVVHNGWNRVTVFTTDSNNYKVPFYSSSNEQERLALGDVNNDGRIDFCIANDRHLLIYYNITPPCGTSGTEEIDVLAVDMTLSPNPATYSVAVKCSGKGEIQIWNTQGSIVYKSGINGNLAIDVSKWVEGVYFVVIADEHGQRQTKKLLKY